MRVSKREMTRRFAESVMESVELDNNLALMDSGNANYQNYLVTSIPFFYELEGSFPEASSKGYVKFNYDNGLEISVVSESGYEIGVIPNHLMNVFRKAYAQIQSMEIAKPTMGVNEILGEVECSIKDELIKVETLADTVRVTRHDMSDTFIQKSNGDKLWSVYKGGQLLCGMESVHDAFRASTLAEQVMDKVREKDFHVVIKNEGAELMSDTRIMEYAQNIIDSNQDDIRDTFSDYDIEVVEPETAIDVIQNYFGETIEKPLDYLKELQLKFEESVTNGCGEAEYKELKTMVYALTPIYGFNEIYSIVNSANYCDFSSPVNKDTENNSGLSR